MNLKLPEQLKKSPLFSRVFSLVAREDTSLQTSEWADDTQLRLLVEDLHTGSTQWIFAYDMDEFLQGLDEINSTRDEDSQVSIRLSHSQSELIRSARQAQYQDEGPQQIFEKDIQLISGGKSIGIWYSASPHEVNVMVQSKRVDFTLPDPFHGAFLKSAQPVMEMQP